MSNDILIPILVTVMIAVLIGFAIEAGRDFYRYLRGKHGR